MELVLNRRQVPCQEKKRKERWKRQKEEEVIIKLFYLTIIAKR